MGWRTLKGAGLAAMTIAVSSLLRMVWRHDTYRIRLRSGHTFCFSVSPRRELGNAFFIWDGKPALTLTDAVDIRRIFLELAKRYDGIFADVIRDSYFHRVAVWSGFESTPIRRRFSNIRIALPDAT